MEKIDSILHNKIDLKLSICARVLINEKDSIIVDREPQPHILVLINITPPQTVMEIQSSYWPMIEKHLHSLVEFDDDEEPRYDITKIKFEPDQLFWYAIRNGESYVVDPTYVVSKSMRFFLTYTVLVPDGHTPDGHVPDGHAPDGHVPDGHAPDGHVTIT